MPFYPEAQIIQHGEALLIASLSSVGGSMANGWFCRLHLSVSDEELVATVFDAFARSRVEEFKDLPKPRSKDATLVSEELGFHTWRAMEAATTLVDLTLVEGDVMVAPYQSLAGRGRQGQDELPPASGPEEIAARVREGLAESARLSIDVVDHEAIAAEQSCGGSGGRSEDARVRERVHDVPNLARAALTRHGGRWAVESLSSVRGDPWEVSNGWVRVVPVGEPDALAGALVEALARSGEASRDQVGDPAAVVVDALEVGGPGVLTGPGTVRLGVMASTGVGELDLFAYELDEEAGWWAAPEHPETRSVGIADPLPLWGTTLEAMGRDLAAVV